MYDFKAYGKFSIMQNLQNSAHSGDKKYVMTFYMYGIVQVVKNGKFPTL